MTSIKIIVGSILLSMTLGLSTLYASGSHDHSHDGHGHGHDHAHHEVTQADVKIIADKKVNDLIVKGKIPKSWKSVNAPSLKKKQFKHAMDWVVLYTNPKITNAKYKELYIFVSLNGNVTGANYTGN